ncbi:MAG: hypoxanthine phosphoribosyltransferase [Desulfuromonadales bacterium]|nr:hypoxanthine phosphoribosyltransferase [Desulfuromonadales bacterium]
MTTLNAPLKSASLTPLISADQIAARIDELACRIDQDYQGKEILMVAVLKGSFLFVADLIRAVKTPSIVDFVRLASYGSATRSSGIVELRKDLELSIKDRHVLIIEDIVDSGLTLESLRSMLLNRQPASLRICTLINKTAHREVEAPVDYVGFTMESGFIVGYGLDLDEQYRNLPDICLIEGA